MPKKEGSTCDRFGEQSNGTVNLIEVETDRYGMTVLDLLHKSLRPWLSQLRRGRASRRL